MNYEVLNNEKNRDHILKLLRVAHNEKIAKVRASFFEAEYNFFRKNITNKIVFDAGCGLGHEAFELVKYNKFVIGIDINKSFVNYAKDYAKQHSIKNVKFEVCDFMKINIKNKSFDSSVLNMGTICDFDNKEEIIKQLLRVSHEFFFDFYPSTDNAFKKRIEMYNQEGFTNVRLEGKTIISDGMLQLYSGSISKKELNKITNNSGYRIEYYPLTDFAIMARVY